MWNPLEVIELASTQSEGSSKKNRASPIFRLRKHDFGIIQQSLRTSTTRKGPRSISQLLLSNNILVISTSDCSILRWNIDSGGDLEEIEVSRKSEDTISKIFLDPTGNHLIISLNNSDIYYLHNKSLRIKKLSKILGNIESVAFNRHHITENNTNIFVLGTSTGCIYEVSLDSTGKERIFNIVYQLDQQLPITSLYYETITKRNPEPSTQFQHQLQHQVQSHSQSSQSSHNREKITNILLLVVTSQPTRLYHFYGASNLTQLFSTYNKIGNMAFIELPGSIRNSSIYCYYNRKDAMPQHFVLMSQLGVYHGNISIGHNNNNGNGINSSGGSSTNKESVSESILVDSQLLHYDPYCDLNSPPPIAITVTEFHAVVLRDGRLTVISRINGSLIIPRQSADSTVTGSSSSTGSTSTSIGDERLYVWSAYLDKAKVTQEEKYFEMAMKHCYSDEQKALVTREQASLYISKQQYTLAAPYLARVVGIYFEDVAVWLSDKDTDNDKEKEYGSSSNGIGNATGNSNSNGVEGEGGSALVRYLQEKLSMLGTSDKVSKGLLGIWIAELFIHHISIAYLKENTAEEVEVTSKFKEFLRNHRSHLDINTIKTLLNNRNLRAVLLHFHLLIDDYEGAVSQLMRDH
eukprot:gene5296-10590_t